MTNTSQLGMLVAATMLLTPSCQKEDFSNDMPAKSKLQFSISVENCTDTRALSDGSNINTLYYALFDKNNQMVANDVITKEASATGFDISVDIVKDQTYKAAFWAQSSECQDYYDVDITNTGMEVTVLYNNIKNNDPNADAFFAVKEGVKISNQTIDVLLERPFAQVNVAITQDNWEQAPVSQKIVSSSATIKNVPNKLNILTGAVSGNETATYTLSNILPADGEKLSIGDTDHVYLSMGYVLADETKSDKEMYFTLNTSTSPIYLNNGIHSAIKRNWRTNIVVNFLDGSIPQSTRVDNTINDFKVQFTQF